MFKLKETVDGNSAVIPEEEQNKLQTVSNTNYCHVMYPGGKILKLPT